jgi:hypothetical protein
MVKELEFEFPEFITHIPINKKDFIKIGYNKIYAGVHFSQRAPLVAAMHGFIERHIPEGLSIQGPVESFLTIYVPVNYGSVKLIVNKETNQREINWKPASITYKSNWDIGNLASIWSKCLDDVVVKKGIIPEDTTEYLIGGGHRFVPVNTLAERKLVYKLKTIE